MLWLRKLTYELRQHPLVRKVWYRTFHVKVSYKTGVVERFWSGYDVRPYNSIKVDHISARIGTPIPIYPLYESDLVSGERPYNYIIVGPKAYKHGSEVDRALIRQQFILQTMDIGYQSKVPWSVVDTDFEKLLNRNNLGPRWNDGILLWPPNRHGRTMLEAFFDYDTIPTPSWRLPLVEGMRKPIRMYNSVRKLEKFGRMLTNRNVIIRMRTICGPTVAYARAYCALFDILGVSGTVYDPHPDVGVKALACSLSGIHYITDHNYYFDKACERGFSSYIGLNHSYGDRGDWVIVDWNFSEHNYERALEYAKNGKRLIVYVPVRKLSKAIDICRPKATIGVYINKYWQLGQYFIW